MRDKGKGLNFLKATLGRKSGRSKKNPSPTTSPKPARPLPQLPTDTNNLSSGSKGYQEYVLRLSKRNSDQRNSSTHEDISPLYIAEEELNRQIETMLEMDEEIRTYSIRDKISGMLSYSISANEVEEFFDDIDLPESLLLQDNVESVKSVILSSGDHATPLNWDHPIFESIRSLIGRIDPA